ncbi:hypothetical protein APHAL10511_002319 [Amanita phalloides]|nr:hypothetical protein APHAL10511_002319 [Amanita phalloides]
MLNLKILTAQRWWHCAAPGLIWGKNPFIQGGCRADFAHKERVLYVFDPKALHHIVIKDQHIYEETTSFIENNKILYGEGLLATLGDQHRRQRIILNPVFNTANMREMIPIFYEVAHRVVVYYFSNYYMLNPRQLKATLGSKVREASVEIDVVQWISRTALELIGTSGFGYSFDSLREGDTPHPYSVSVKELMSALFPFLFYRMYILPIAARLLSMKTRRWIVDLLPSRRLHRVRDIVDVIRQLSVEIYESKKKYLIEGDEAVTKQIGAGKDVLSVLMKANLDVAEGDRLSDEEIIGQISTLTFAAVDTTTTALSRIFHLLALHPEVQDALRREVSEARANHGDLPFEQLVSLPYMDAVFRETLRLYPPVPTFHRTARKDMVLPLSTPIKGMDGRDMHEVFVPKNTLVLVSAFSSNRNPEVWGPDADEWKPERWFSPPRLVADAHIPGIYSRLMTFMGGGRACIGYKFSELEIKVVLSLLVEGFGFKPSGKEIFWKMTGITAPVVLGGDGRPGLPLVISLAK